MNNATAIGLTIYRDILTGNFDPTLRKYDPIGSIAFPEKEANKADLKTLIQERLNNKYSETDHSLLSHLTNYAKPVNSSHSGKLFYLYLNRLELQPSTINRYMNTCKALNREWFIDCPRLKEPKKEIRPFTQDEINRILLWVKRHDPRFYGYVLFLFHTGVRTSEAIGVRWSDIDLSDRVVTINSTLGRNRGSSAKRSRRQTKNGKGRRIPLSDKLWCYLNSIDRKGELVFTSPTGKPIDDSNFLDRVWHPCLFSLKVTYRPQYNTRHTFASHALEKGMSPQTVAYLLGDNLETVVKRYAGIIAMPKTLDIYG
ncbi:MAG: hypothetical protein OHK0012_07360 [Synechococcales cyanobacterium]